MKPALTKTTTSLAILCLLGLQTVGFAQTTEASIAKVIEPQTAFTHPTGMRELVLLVLQNHPELGQAEAESRMAVSRLSEAKAGMYPHLPGQKSF